jgi:hypothetical protein
VEPKSQQNAFSELKQTNKRNRQKTFSNFIQQLKTKNSWLGAAAQR